MDILVHSGTPHEGSTPHSGRYEFGSGENPFQHGTETVRQAVARLRREGLSDTDIAYRLGMNTNEMRKRISAEKNEELAANIHRADMLKRKGYQPSRIAEMMNVPERTVYNWLNPTAKEKVTKKQALVDNLKAIVDEKGYVDVGPGTEYSFNTTQTGLASAFSVLKEDGYSVHAIKVPMVTDKNKTLNVKVLCKPGTEWAYIQKHPELIQPITEFSDGYSLKKVQYPSSISSDRVGIRYAEEGGLEHDGVMLIRRGVKDLNMGKSNYAQVRIAVDGTHYLKGMAMYADDKDLPDGVDILFNTNKKLGTPKMDVLKELKKDKRTGEIDENLPFGAVIKANGQNYYEDKNGGYYAVGNSYEPVDENTPKDAKRYSLSPINKLKEEGEWNDYSKTLSSQFLSKQSIHLIRKQLNLTYAEKVKEFEDICNLTQPEIKKKMLLEFASECDSAAVDLKATALPRQTTKVILPLDCIKDDQIYAPGYSNGERVALIRYPHAGLFEIPILTVNNNNKEAKRIVGPQPIDAVGITSKTAEKLSGADFDGDTVVVIPLSSKVNIDSRPQLKGLKNFDPKSEYKGYEGMKKMTERDKGLEMGLISNLITDMTLVGAPDSEMERAVKHSMVVIDAYKHGLNWKLSEEQNGIAALRKEYQGGKARGGASTLISKASGQATDLERKQFNPNQHINKETGEIEYGYSGREYFKTSIKDADGKKKTISVYADSSKYKYKSDSGEEFTKDSVKYKKIDGRNVLVAEKRNSDGSILDIPVTVDKSQREFFYYDKSGSDKSKRIYVDSASVKVFEAQEKTTKMEMAFVNGKDAFSLSSGTDKEAAYAEYANSVKALANKARLEYVNTPNSKKDKSAAEAYKNEVASLKASLELAIMNRPKERMAQVKAASEVKEILKFNDLSDEEEKKLRQKALSKARAEVGADKKSVYVQISDKEWEAIMNGALSSNVVSQILDNSDSDMLKQRATPKERKSLSDAQINILKLRAASGFTIDEIAQSLGVSSSTVTNYLSDEKKGE